MSNACFGCGRTFSKQYALKRHQQTFPSHSRLTIAGFFNEHRVPRSPITDALRDADLIYLPTAEPERLALFGDLLPRISNIGHWKSSYSFDDIRRIMLSSMLQSNDPVSRLQFLFFSIVNKYRSKYGTRKESQMTTIRQHRSLLASMQKSTLRRHI